LLHVAMNGNICLQGRQHDEGAELRGKLLI
jgi:hypothetical protein